MKTLDQLLEAAAPSTPKRQTSSAKVAALDERELGNLVEDLFAVVQIATTCGFSACWLPRKNARKRSSSRRMRTASEDEEALDGQLQFIGRGRRHSRPAADGTAGREALAATTALIARRRSIASSL